jgi:Cu(I)/Ag(I) efflux system membrane protein CusA/SilA
MIMDMPITLPKIGIEAATNDLKARNMTLCRFPEIRMVAGKVGRAETAFDPAPIDMIESMIEFQPESRWPRRRLEPTAAGRITQKIIDGLVKENLIVPPVEEAALAEQVTNEALRRLDAVQREFCWQLQQAFRAEARRLLALEAVEQWAARRTSGGGPATPMPALQVASLVDQLPRADLDRLFMRCDQTALHVVLLEVQRLLDTVDGLPIAQDLHTDSATDMRIDPRSIEALEASILRAVQRAEQRAWDAHLAQTNRALALRIGPTYLQLVLDELLARVVVRDSKFADYWDQVLDVRSRANDQATVHHTGTHRLMVDSLTRLPMIDPYPTFNRWRSDMLRRIERDIRLVPQTAEALTATDGELDTALKVPGWANVWTRPIQNRIDMLATGVNAEIGIRVSGPELSLVVDTSERIAAVVSQLPGAQNPIADPIRGKEYFALRVDDERAAARSVNPDDAQIAFALATSGQLVGRWTDRDQEFSVRLLLTGHSPSGPVEPLAIPIARATGVSSDPRDGATADPWIRLGQIATVESFDGPATIKSENGLIRNYVRLNVVGRSPKDFVDEAKLAIAQTVPLPPGVMVAWSGQFEHAQQTRRLLLWIIPTALLLIAGLLWLAFRDLADAGTMFLSVPLAIAGGAICQWMLGIPFSLAVAIGYLACLGMAATTSMIMLVYLRDSLAKCGDLSRISELELRTAVIDGAVQRLRPKFLTEATTIIGLAPVLWSTGLGSDVIRPMAVPVLGGILIADEVVDLLIPLVFYQVRRRRKQHLPEPVFADRKRELE